jgi:hypothetical protein
VKRAEGYKVCARPLEREVRADDFDDVIGGANLFERCLGDQSGHALSIGPHRRRIQPKPAGLAWGRNPPSVSMMKRESTVMEGKPRQWRTEKTETPPQQSRGTNQEQDRNQEQQGDAYGRAPVLKEISGVENRHGGQQGKQMTKQFPRLRTQWQVVEGTRSQYHNPDEAGQKGQQHPGPVDGT